MHNEKNHDVTDKDLYLKLFIIKTNPNVQSTMADLWEMFTSPMWSHHRTQQRLRVGDLSVL